MTQETSLRIIMATLFKSVGEERGKAQNRQVLFDVTSVQRDTGSHLRSVVNIEKDKWQLRSGVLPVILHSYDSDYSKISKRYLTVVKVLLWKSAT